MNNRLPSNLAKTKICIVCEGDEEYEYLDKLKKLDVWSEEYDIVLENADGNGNIPAIYQNKYQNGSYELVLVFCDTDKKPYEQYSDIKYKIDEFHGVDGASDRVVIYGNPCTMQIIILHWLDVVLKSPAKKVNAPIIEACIGVCNYKARADQREQLFACVDNENYEDMLERVKKLPDDDIIPGSSNFGRFMDYLSSDDDSWIAEINEVLEG